MIHAQAIVDPGAKIAEDVSIGPWSDIGPDVEIGAGTVIGPHVVVRGPARIGQRNRIFQFCSIGEEPQDKKYAGEPTRLEIGDDNTIREFCTINRGTVQDRGVTSVGDGNWIMATVHFAHDCLIGNGNVFANLTSLAGHVTIGDNVILGGGTLVHQFCKVGDNSFAAAGTLIFKDVPPYVMASGNPASPHGINKEGMRRAGMESAAIAAIMRAYKIIYRQGLRTEQAIEELSAMETEHAGIRPLTEFLRNSQRGIIR